MVFSNPSKLRGIIILSEGLSDDFEPGKTQEQLFLSGVVEKHRGFEVRGDTFDLQYFADAKALVFDGNSRDDLRGVVAFKRILPGGNLPEPVDFITKVASESW